MAVDVLKRIPLIRRVSISLDNTKTGNVASVSMPPGPKGTCGRNSLVCWHPAGCLAWKLYMGYRKAFVAPAWDRNYRLWQEDPDDFFGQIYDWLRANNPEHWRWFIGGDTPHHLFSARALDLMAEFPLTSFMAFTKNPLRWRNGAYRTGRDEIRPLPNFNLLVSAWPQAPMPAGYEGLPVAWMQDGTEDRIPPGTTVCHGGCVECEHGCWGDPSDKTFPKH